jgi:hypothetical protein
MNDPFEIERLAPDNRLCQGGENKDEIATSLCAIAFYLAPFGKAPSPAKRYQAGQPGLRLIS